MTARTRPEECCERPVACAPLPKRPRTALVEMFKALSDPTRLEIFRLIAAQPAPLCACDVVDRFHLRQPTISHHLAVLRDAGLIDTQRRGVWAYYSVRAEGLALLRTATETLAPAACCATACCKEP